MALTAAQHLQKTFVSLRNAAVRGRKPAGCIPQISKYEALRLHFLESDKQTWAQFCEANGIAPEHTAFHILMND